MGQAESIPLDTMKWVPFPAILILAGLLACHTDTISMKPLDLHPYGIPMTIQAPDSTVITEKDYKFMRDLTLKKAPEFDIQLFELNASSEDAAGEKFHQLESVRQDPYFRQVIQEDEYGFIFSKYLDSLNVDYDFRVVKLIGDKELIFQTGLAGSFNLEQVKRMYDAVK
jgi:hypothetical protein